MVRQRHPPYQECLQPSDIAHRFPFLWCLLLRRSGIRYMSHGVFPVGAMYLESYSIVKWHAMIRSAARNGTRRYIPRWILPAFSIPLTDEHSRWCKHRETSRSQTDAAGSRFDRVGGRL